MPAFYTFGLFARQVLCAVAVVLILIGLVGYIVLIERRRLALLQSRPELKGLDLRSVGRYLATFGKALAKKESSPRTANNFIFWLAPAISLAAAVIGYAALSFAPLLQISDVDTGIALIFAISSLGIFGIILGSWISADAASVAALLRRAAQFISFQSAAGLALVSAIIIGGSLSTKSLVDVQEQTGAWSIFLAPLGLLIYLTASIAQTGCLPFELKKAESRILTGDMTVYGGLRWTLYLLAEYANLILVACIATAVFLGGWLRPIASFHDHVFGTAVEFLDTLPPVLLSLASFYWFRKGWHGPAGAANSRIYFPGFVCLALSIMLGASLALPSDLMAAIHGVFWFLAKVLGCLYVLLWLRFSSPLNESDQFMKLSWQLLVPLAIVNVLGVASAQFLRAEHGWSALIAFGLASAITLIVGGALAVMGDRVERQEVTFEAEEVKQELVEL